MSTDKDNAKREAEAAFRPKVQRCQHTSGCNRLTTRKLCALHDPLPPEGMWIISQQVRDELNPQHEGKDKP